MFTGEHLIWIGLCAAFITAMTVLSRRNNWTLRRAGGVMTVICVCSEVSKIMSDMQASPYGGMTLAPQSLPFHLCSMMIFAVLYITFGREGRGKQTVIDFVAVMGTLGSFCALMIPTNGTDFTRIGAYQCFVYRRGTSVVQPVFAALRPGQAGAAGTGAEFDDSDGAGFRNDLCERGAVGLRDEFYVPGVRPPLGGTAVFESGEWLVCLFPAADCPGCGHSDGVSPAVSGAGAPRQKGAGGGPMKQTAFHSPDLHMHSVYSDGTDTPRALLQRVRAAGLDIFALTDHDTAQGCAAVRALLEPGDAAFVEGIEFSCQDGEGKYHVLGYGFDAEKPSIRAAADFAHHTRILKMQNRFGYLARRFGFTFTEEERSQLLALKNPGKPHFVDMMLKKGYVKTKMEGFEAFSGCPDTEPTLSPEEAIDAIIQAKGIPVLAHGILADGSKKTVGGGNRRPGGAAEGGGASGPGVLLLPAFTPRQREIMLALAERCRLLVTAGSD